MYSYYEKQGQVHPGLDKLHEMCDNQARDIAANKVYKEMSTKEKLALLRFMKQITRMV